MMAATSGADASANAGAFHFHMLVICGVSGEPPLDPQTML